MKRLSWVALVCALTVSFGSVFAVQSTAEAAVATTTIQDTAQGTGLGQVQFSSGWSPCSGNCGKATSDNSFQWTSTVGSSVTVRFSGSQIKLYGVKEPWAYIATAAIDGGATVDVDYYAAAVTTSTVEVYSSPTLSQGTHTLVLTMTNRKNAASSGGNSITFDRAEVVSGTDTSTATIQDTARGTGLGQVQFSSGWSPCSGNCGKATSDNSFQWTSTVGSSVTVRFSGSQIKLYGVKEPWAYIATAAIDGGATVDVDYYAAAVTTSTVEVYSSPTLSQGTHTLVLTMTNRKNAASSGGNSITFDRAEVVSGGSTTSSHASGMPWSDGGYFEHDGAKAAAFQQWRGRPVDNVVAFASREAWVNLLSTWWTQSLPDSFVPERDDLIISVPLWTENEAAPAKMGTDANWTQLARGIAEVDPNAYVRLGWEMNCCEFSKATAGQESVWRNQFSRAVTLIKAAAPGLKIVFNPNEGASQDGTFVQDASTLFVDGKVDVIALDAYDWWQPYNSDANANNHFTKQYGWNWWYDFARSKGLPFGLAEFSVYSGTTVSGGDNPAYFTYVYNWLSSKNNAAPGSIAFVSVYNESATYCGCNLFPTNPNPNAAQRYRSIIQSLSQ